MTKIVNNEESNFLYRVGGRLMQANVIQTEVVRLFRLKIIEKLSTLMNANKIKCRKRQKLSRI